MDLLQESSSRALRSCHNLAQAYPPLARELFYAAFFSIWQVLNEKFRALFVQSILTALQSPRIGPDVMLILLNLTEFMEHDDKPLPIEIATLGRIAERRALRSSCYVLCAVFWWYRFFLCVLTLTHSLISPLLQMSGRRQGAAL